MKKIADMVSFIQSEGRYSMGSSIQKPSLAIITSVIAVLYVVLGEISFSIFRQDSIVTIAVFLPEGVALAAALIYRSYALPGIFIGQLALALLSGMDWRSALGISAGNAVEAWIAYVLWERFGLDRRLSKTRDLFGLFLLIGFVLQPFSALFGNGVLYLTGHITHDFFHSVFFWWFGNSMGQLLLTPMLLILYSNEGDTRLSEYALVVFFFVLLSFVMEVVLDIRNISLLLAATLPFAIYLATVSLPYATVGTFTLVASSLIYASFGWGTFADTLHPVDNLINLNFFILIHIFLVLLVGVAFREKLDAIGKLQSIAHIDPLTGLPNRHVLREEMHHAIYLAETQGRSSVIAFVDFDEFKQINDTLGHKAGDEVLKTVSDRIRHVIGASDVLIRLGGDEFLLILYEKSAFDAKPILEEILTLGSRPISIGEYTVSVSLSIGVAVCPEDGMNVDELVAHADAAMYRAKEEGKNAIAWSQAQLSTRSGA